MLYDSAFQSKTLPSIWYFFWNIFFAVKLLDKIVIFLFIVIQKCLPLPSFQTFFNVQQLCHKHFSGIHVHLHVYKCHVHKRVLVIIYNYLHFIYHKSHSELMSFYLSIIHAYSISLWFFFILHCLLNSMLQHSLLIRVNSFFYLCYKREFKHANHKALSIKTNTSCMNLMLHYDARRQCARYNCCSPKKNPKQRS